MKEDLVPLFITLGLGRAEAIVYLAGIQLGPASVQDIAKRANLSRTATYDAVETLKSRGLISVIEQDKRRLFSMSDPETLVSYFESRIGRMHKQFESLTSFLPELVWLNAGARPTVRFYEGEEVLHAVFQDLVSACPYEICEVTNLNDVYETLNTRRLYESRKLLDPDRQTIRILHRGDLRSADSRIQFRELGEQFGDFHGDLVLYDSHIVLVSFLAKIEAVIIDNRPFASLLKTLFEAAWQECEG